MTSSNITKDFLITGGSGFLGTKMVEILSNDYSIATLGSTKNNDIIADLSSSKSIETKLNAHTIIHCAGKAHSNPKGAKEIEKFYAINLGGTIKICNWIDEWDTPPNSFIFISTVAVYGQEHGENIDENFLPQPHTPYACSKHWAELYLYNWAKKKNIQLVILRLPLIVSENPPGNLGAMVRAIKSGYYLRIGNGLARRSMVNAVDIAKTIKTVGAFPGVYNLTDGIHPNFSFIENYIASQFGRKIIKMPVFIANLLATVGDLLPGFPFNSIRLEKINSTLTFSDDKARNTFGWNPKPALTEVSFKS